MDRNSSFQPIPGVALRIAPGIGFLYDLGHNCNFESSSENCPRIPRVAPKMALSQQLKKGVFSQGFFAEIACNVIFPLLGCAQRLHESSAKRCLVQNFGWCDSGPRGAKILTAELERGECSAEGGLQCTLHFRGPQKIGGQISDIFRHFPHPLFCSV